jgi:hypothetical protein
MEVARAQVAEEEAAFTATGLRRWVVVPSPNWPKELSPQQYARPPAVTPQV